MSNTEDIVQRVRVETDDELERAFQKMAANVAPAIDRVSKSFEAASSAINKSSSAIVSNIGAISNALNKPFAGGTQGQIANLAKSFQTLGPAVSKAGDATGNVIRNTASIASTIGSAGLKVAGVARVLFELTRTQNAATIEAKKSTEEQAQAQVQAATTAIQQEQAEAGLLRQFAAGKITAEQYGEQLNELRVQADQQAAAQQRLAAVQASVNHEQAQAQAKDAERAATLKIEQSLGVRVTQSLLNLGRTLDQVSRSFLTAFGPTIAGVINSFADAIQTAGPKIEQAFLTIQQVLSPLFDDTTKVFSVIVEGIATFATQAIKAFVNIIIPAFKGFMAVLNGVAAALNSAFGTNITGQQLLVVLIVGKLIGVFGLLGSTIGVVVAVVRTLAAAMALASASPLGLALAGLAIALGVIAVKLGLVDFATFTGGAKSAGDATTQMATDTATATAAAGASVDTFATEGAAKLRTYSDAQLKAINDSEAARLAAQKQKTDIQALGQSAESTGTDLQTSAQTGQQSWTSFLGALQGPVQTAIILFDQLAQSARNAASAAGSGAGGASSKAPGFAGGGRVRGPGTGTSDSILARVSNDEHIIKAKQARRWRGVLEAINAGRFQLPGYADGGAVGLGSPRVRFAASNAVTASQRAAFDLILDGQRFSGLSAPQDVAESLQRSAVKRRMAKAGRDPNWKGRK